MMTLDLLEKLRCLPALVRISIQIFLKFDICEELKTVGFGRRNQGIVVLRNKKLVVNRLYDFSLNYEEILNILYSFIRSFLNFLISTPSSLTPFSKQDILCGETLPFRTSF